MTYSELENLKKQRERLYDIITRAENRLKNAPEGILEIQIPSGRPRYYKKEFDSQNDRRRRTFINAENRDLARALAQKCYDQKIRKAAQKQLRVIDAFLSGYDANVLKDIFSKLSPERRELVTTEEVDDEEYARRWSAVQYAAGDFENDFPEFYTQKGERVRSKAEIIIADNLHSHGIPYLQRGRKQDLGQRHQFSIQHRLPAYGRCRDRKNSELSGGRTDKRDHPERQYPDCLWIG